MRIDPPGWDKVTEPPGWARLDQPADPPGWDWNNGPGAE